MDTQPIANCCPKCQTPLPPDAPQGLCPKCLFAAVATPTEADQPAGHRPAPPALTEIAAAFPQLEILEFIGQGGMGFVFKARQPKLDRLVALKILPQSLADDPTFAERFNREAKLLARLSHPGIVTVHDFGVAVAAGILPAREPGVPPGGKGVEILGTLPNSEAIASSSANPGGKMPPSTSGQRPDTTRFYYLLMEFVDGVNLRQAMQAGRFTPEQALAIVPKICEALQFAHNEGILHRDIKPENILLDAKGRVKIADFGIAKLVGNVAQASQPAGSGGVPAASSWNTEQGCSVHPQAGKPALQSDALTEAGKTLGSPNYMAPEQLEHPDEVDHRADIYSLGVVFYEMLTGELPLGRFAPPSQKSAADPRVDEVVLRALEKERERRQHSAGEVQTQVETIVSDPKKPEGVPRHFFPPETPLPTASSGNSFSDARRWWTVLAIPGIFLVCYFLKGGRLVDYLGSDSFELSLALMGTFALLTLLSHVRKKRGRIVLVGVSSGKREINWTGVIQMWVVIYAAFLAGSYFAFSRWVPIHDLIAGMVGAATLVTAALVQVELKKPFEQLPPAGSRRLPRQSEAAAGDEAHSEKPEIGNRKSEISPRFSRTAIRVAVWLVIIGGVLVFALVRNHITKPTGMPLSATEFWQKFEANQIERATVSYNPQSPGVAKISGTYYRTDKDGNIIKTENEVPFIVENVLITPNLERKLELSDKIVFNTPNPMLKAVAYNLLFLGGFGLVILLLLGIIIYVLARVIKRPVGVPVPPVQKPDRFWRWFAVAVFAMIAIPFLISIVGLLAAIAIPNYVKGRAQAQENARRAAAQMVTNQLPDLNLSFGPVVARILPFQTNGVTDAFGLESNQVVKLPHSGRLPNSLLFLDDDDGNAIYIGGQLGVSVMPVKNQSWETISTAKCAEMLAAKTNLLSMALVKKSDLPAIFLFKTQRGTAGVLKIASSTDREGGLGLNYKFITENSTNAVLFPPQDYSQTVPPTGFKPIPPEAVRLFQQSRELMSARLSNLPHAETKASLLEWAKTYMEMAEISRKLAPLLKGTAFESAQWRQMDAVQKWQQLDPNKDKEKWNQAEKELHIAQFTTERLMAEAGAADIIQPGAGKLKFGPWKEAVVSRPSTGTNCCVNFDAGMVLTPPSAILTEMTVTNRPGNDFFEAMPESFSWAKYRADSKATNTLARWIEDSNVDAVALGTYGLVVFCPLHASMRIDETGSGADWESQISPAWLLWKIHFTEEMNAVPKFANTYEVLTLPTDTSSATNDLCYFRTRSGTFGVLQIAGFTENPPGVKLRYKLVQNSTSTNSQ